MSRLQFCFLYNCYMDIVLEYEMSKFLVFGVDTINVQLKDINGPVRAWNWVGLCVRGSC